MPRDRKGNTLTVGDKVLISCIVKSIQEGNEFCNIELETHEVMPGNETTNTFHLNTKQVQKYLGEALGSDDQPPH